MAISFGYTNRGSNNNQNQGDDSWKASAWLNLYLPGGTGRVKLSEKGLPLRESNVDEAYVMEQFKQYGNDPAFIQMFKDALILDFRLAQQPTAPRIALPAFQPKQP